MGFYLNKILNNFQVLLNFKQKHKSRSMKKFLVFFLFTLASSKVITEYGVTCNLSPHDICNGHCGYIEPYMEELYECCISLKLAPQGKCKAHEKNDKEFCFAQNDELSMGPNYFWGELLDGEVVVDQSCAHGTGCGLGEFCMRSFAEYQAKMEPGVRAKFYTCEKDWSLIKGLDTNKNCVNVPK